MVRFAKTYGIVLTVNYVQIEEGDVPKTPEEIRDRRLSDLGRAVDRIRKADREGRARNKNDVKLIAAFAAEYYARDAYGGNYNKARIESFRRSGGICQLCGLKRATEAHHWSILYPDGEVVTSDDLTALCTTCHLVATDIRRAEVESYETPMQFIATGPGEIADCRGDSESNPTCLPGCGRVPGQAH